jgi:hypothetical protein
LRSRPLLHYSVHDGRHVALQAPAALLSACRKARCVLGPCATQCMKEGTLPSSPPPHYFHCVWRRRMTVADHCARCRRVSVIVWSQQYTGSVWSRQYKGFVLSRQYRGFVLSQQYRGSVSSRQYRGSVWSRHYRGSIWSRQYTGSVWSRQYIPSVWLRQYRATVWSPK